MASVTAFSSFRKRNGMIVPFRESKIESAVVRAAEAVARMEGMAPDKAFAARVSERVVTELDNPLCEYYVQPDDAGQRIPRIEDVQDLVEIVLAEEGHSAMVASYKRYRKQREVARTRIRVRDRPGNGDVDVTDTSLLLVESSTSDVTLPWSRGRITRQLLDRTDLSNEVAISVAKAVENQVISSSLSTVNTTLIRELVNNELSGRGFREQLRDLSLYGVSRDFVESLMYAKSTENSNIVNNNPEAVNLGLAELVLKQWALDTISRLT